MPSTPPKATPAPPTTRPLNSGETPSDIARKGYDQTAQVYLDWTTSLDSPRMLWLDKLFDYIRKASPSHGKVTSPHAPLQWKQILELGCGAGVPTTLQIAKTTGRVVGLDISQTQIDLAQKYFADAGITVDGDSVQLRAQDILEAEFEKCSFDAICAFYSIIHLSVPDQEAMLGKCARWLRPGGALLFNMGTHPSVEGNQVNEDWLGMKAYWASPGAEGMREMLERLGLSVREMKGEKTEGDADFTWFIATVEVL